MLEITKEVFRDARYYIKEILLLETMAFSIELLCCFYAEQAFNGFMVVKKMLAMLYVQAVLMLSLDLWVFLMRCFVEITKPVEELICMFKWVFVWCSYRTFIWLGYNNWSSFFSPVENPSLEASTMTFFTLLGYGSLPLHKQEAVDQLWIAMLTR